jgi:hypothetical protein
MEMGVLETFPDFESQALVSDTQAKTATTSQSLKQGAHAGDVEHPQCNQAEFQGEHAAGNSQGRPPRVIPEKMPLFGLQRPRKVQRGSINNSFDYEKKYEDDEWGEEWGPNARVWRVYSDEAQIYDTEMTEAWKDTLDVFLIFVGLFSAVGATFLGISVLLLQPDYGQITASLITEFIAIQRAAAEGISPRTIPPSSLNVSTPPSPSNSDLWVNGLWFTSLALSLCAAIIAVLIKQWIQQYMKFISGSPITQVQQRQFRFEQLERWRVPVIIGLLPLVLHTAVFLYLIGLTIFLLSLNREIGIIVGTVTGLALTIYSISSLLPLIFLGCPYKTPLATLFHDHLFEPVDRLFKISREGFRACSRACGNNHSVWIRLKTWHNTIQRIPSYTLRKKEMEAVIYLSNRLELSAVAWLYSISSNPTISNIAMQSLSAIPFELGSDTCRNSLISVPTIFDSMSRRFHSQNPYSDYMLGNAASIIVTERLGRALCRLSQPLRFPGFLHEDMNHCENSSLSGLGGLAANSQYNKHMAILRKDNYALHSESDLFDELFNSHPSIWCGLLSLRSMQPLGSGLGIDGALLLRLFISVQPTHIQYSSCLDDNSQLDYIRCSLMIRHLSFRLATQTDKTLQSLIDKFDKLDSMERCTLEHRRLTISMFSHVLLGVLKIVTSQPTIGFLLLPLQLDSSCQCINSWLTNDTSAFTTFDGKILRRIWLAVLDLPGSFRAELKVSPSFHSTWSLLLVSLRGYEGDFDEEDFHLCLRLAGTSQYPIRPLSLFDKVKDSIILTNSFICLLDHHLAGSSDSLSPAESKSNQWIFSVAKDHTAVLLLISALWVDYLPREEDQRIRASALAAYVHRLIRLAATSQDFLAACFIALENLLIDDDIRYAYAGANVYLAALTEKLKTLDPTCNGHRKTNKDDNPALIFYERIRICKNKDELHKTRPDARIITRFGRKIVFVPLQQKRLLNILDDHNTTALPLWSKLKSRMSGLLDWRKQLPSSPV